MMVKISDISFFADHSLDEWPRKSRLNIGGFVLRFELGFCDEIEWRCAVGIESSDYKDFLNRRTDMHAASAEFATAVVSISPRSEVTESSSPNARVDESEFKFNERLYRSGYTYVSSRRFVGFLKSLVATLDSRHLVIDACFPGGLIYDNLGIWEPGLLLTYLLLRDGCDEKTILDNLRRSRLLDRIGSEELLAIIQRERR